MSMTGELEQLFAAVGCRGQVCVQRVGGCEIGLDAAAPAVAASVIKVLIAVEVQRQLAAGRLDATERVLLPASARTPGPVGFSLYQDAVELSLRDLVVAMLTLSDNVAADTLLERVGINACNTTAKELGLADTVVVSDLHTMIAGLAHDAGFADWDTMDRWAEGEQPAADRDAMTTRLLTARALDPATTTRTTARDMCILLSAIWTDRATDANGCAPIRRLMAAQLTRQRLATGFGPPARVAAKSGGLVGVVRNEVGVVSYPGGPWYAVAVFTSALHPRVDGRAVDTAIGRAAAIAVEAASTAIPTGIPAPAPARRP